MESLPLPRTPPFPGPTACRSTPRLPTVWLGPLSPPTHCPNAGLCQALPGAQHTLLFAVLQGLARPPLLWDAVPDSPWRKVKPGIPEPPPVLSPPSFSKPRSRRLLLPLPFLPLPPHLSLPIYLLLTPCLLSPLYSIHQTAIFFSQFLFIAQMALYQQ